MGTNAQLPRTGNLPVFPVSVLPLWCRCCRHHWGVLYITARYMVSMVSSIVYQTLKSWCIGVTSA
jgi:hypothetical protein